MRCCRGSHNDLPDEAREEVREIVIVAIEEIARAHGGYTDVKERSLEVMT